MKQNRKSYLWLFLVVFVLLSTKTFTSVDKLKKDEINIILQFLHLTDILNFRVLSPCLKEKFEKISHCFIKRKLLEEWKDLNDFVSIELLSQEDFVDNAQNVIFLPNFIKGVHKWGNFRVIFLENKKVMFEQKTYKIPFQFTQFSLKNRSLELLNVNLNKSEKSDYENRMVKTLDNLRSDRIEGIVKMSIKGSLGLPIYILNNLALVIGKVGPKNVTVIPSIVLAGDNIFFQLKSKQYIIGIYSQRENIARFFSCHGYFDGLKPKFLPIETDEMREKILNGTLEIEFDSLEEFDIQLYNDHDIWGNEETDIFLAMM